MRTIALAFLIFIFLYSCKVNKPFKSVDFPLTKKSKLLIDIPKNYYFSHLCCGAEYESYVFRYSDSSMIYITDGPAAGENWDNIKNDSLDTKLLIANLDKDTLILSGIDKKGLYWKNSFYGTFGVGYKNVPKEKKEMFEKCVSGFKIK